MEQKDISLLNVVMPLVERYGLAVVLLFLLLSILFKLIWMIVRGDLVPRDMLERAEEDRDRLQAILDHERAGFMSPLLEFVQTMKKDNEEHGGSERI